MRIYADRPWTGIRQLLTDLLVVAWIWVWIKAASRLYDLVEKLAVPGRKLEDAGNGMASSMTDASHRVDNVPGVGRSLATPFTKAADAAAAMAQAGQQQQQSVHDLAIILVVLLLIVPFSLVLFGWLPLRIRWMRRATAAASLRTAEAGTDLLALRALATQPLRKLADIDPDVAAGWRNGDRATVNALAALQLRSLGLRAPR